MSRAPWILALALVVLAVAWGFGRLAPTEPEQARAPARRRQASARPAASPESTRPASPSVSDPADVAWRDLFVYADGPTPRASVDPPLTPEASAPPLAPTPVPEPPVRWVGFVRWGEELRAALSDHGQVVVVGVGDRVDGRMVGAVDLERGVRLLADDGREEWLAPAR